MFEISFEEKNIFFNEENERIFFSLVKNDFAPVIFVLFLLVFF